MSRRTPLTMATILMLALGVAAVPTTTAADAPVDTIRTNLWVAKALMADILSDALDELPDGTPGVLLEPTGRDESLDLMQTVAYDMVTRRGMQAYLAVPAFDDPEDEEDPDDMDEEEEWGLPGIAEAPYILGFRIDDIDVSYPAAGRRLGLWRTWIDRECTVSVIVMLRDRRDGLIVHDRQDVRTFGDRLPAKVHGDLATESYEFTVASIEAGGGIGAIVEEVVVLGALAGLVAAYFATTAD